MFRTTVTNTQACMSMAYMVGPLSSRAGRLQRESVPSPSRWHATATVGRLALLPALLPARRARAARRRRSARPAPLRPSVVSPC